MVIRFAFLKQVASRFTELKETLQWILVFLFYCGSFVLPKVIHGSNVSSEVCQVSGEEEHCNDYEFYGYYSLQQIKKHGS